MGYRRRRARHVQKRERTLRPGLALTTTRRGGATPEEKPVRGGHYLVARLPQRVAQQEDLTLEDLTLVSSDRPDLVEVLYAAPVRVAETKGWTIAGGGVAATSNTSGRYVP